MIAAGEPSELSVEALPRARLPDVVEVLREASAWSGARGAPLWTARELGERAFAVSADRGEVFGLLSGRQLVACMLLHDVDPIHWPESAAGEALYVHKLAVRRSAAGRNLGRHMIEFACRTARARGVGKLRLDTVPATRLEPYYTRLGFIPDARGPALYAGRWLIRMEKRLAPSNGDPSTADLV